MAEIKKKTLRLTTLAVLGALAIVLSALENLIPPLPMMPPGAKLGLSNIVTMFAAGTFGLIPALAIALLKALFAGATRGVTALLMSLAGGLLSTLVMGLLFRLKRHAVSLLAVGILGAVAGIVLAVNGISIVSLMNRWTPIISADTILLGLGAGALVGVLAGLYPAAKASRIDPAQTLAAG